MHIKADNVHCSAMATPGLGLPCSGPFGGSVKFPGNSPRTDVGGGLTTWVSFDSD